MTELIEKIAVPIHPSGDEACPFCPGKKENKCTTYKGEENSSGELRKCMNVPKRNSCSQQKSSQTKAKKASGPARKKDGKDGRQNVDTAKPSPGPIFNSLKYGVYGDQAHHAISGNEIMKGHRIEEVITKGSNFKDDTGYTINNCANGVYLPAFPKKYAGIWGSKTYPKTYPVEDGCDPVKINSIAEDQLFKLKVMKRAMDRKGQAHIGGHEGFYIEELPDYKKSYPSIVKDELNKIVKRVKEKGGECPFCFEADKPKKPFVPPYKVNQWLDNLSEDVAAKLSAPPAKWPYFISQIARDYFKEKHVPADTDDFLS